MSASSLKSLGYMDDLIREYLVFRGFINAFRAFDNDKKTDRLKGFNVDRLVDSLYSHIQTFDYKGMVSFWQYLNQRFFSYLDGDYDDTIAKLFVSLQRLYVVNCVRFRRTDKLEEFFTANVDELTAGTQWQAWFALPYIKSPETDPTFEVYFSKHWMETFTLSLQNFLSTVLRSMGLPKLLNFNTERLLREKLSEDLRAAKAEADKLRAELHALQEAQAQAQASQQAMVNSSGTAKRRETFSLKDVFKKSGKTNSQANMSVSVPLDVSSPSRANMVTSERLRDSLTTSSVYPTASPEVLNLDEKLYSVREEASGGDEDNGANEQDVDGADSDEEAEEADEADPEDDGDAVGDDDALDYQVQLQRVIAGHTASVTCAKFSTTGTMIASGSSDGTVRVSNFNIEDSSSSSSSSSPGGTGKTTSVYCGSKIRSLCWDSRASKILYCGSSTRTVVLWSSETSQVCGEILSSASMPEISALVTSPTDPLLAMASSSGSTGADTGELSVWNVKTAQQLYSLALDPAPTCVNTMCFNHNGSMLFTGGADGMMRIYDMNSGNSLMGWFAHEGAVASLALTANETSILTLGTDGSLYEWSLHKFGHRSMSLNLGQFRLPQHNPQGLGLQMALNADCSKVLLTSFDNDARLYSLRSQRLLQTIGDHAAPVVTVDFHPTQPICLTGSVDHTLRVNRLVGVEKGSMRSSSSFMDNLGGMGDASASAAT